jgi:hypothetical protein
LSDKPNTPEEAPLKPNDPAAIRRAHIAHEATLRSLGLLYYLGTIFLVLLAVITLYLGTPADIQAPLSDPLSAALALGGALLLGLTGRGLRTLRPWARVPVMSLSTLGLFYFPMGTMICGYALYLVLCRQGQVVFSQGYQQVIEATPEIDYRTPWIAWLLFGLILLIMLSAAFGRLLSGTPQP